MKLIDKNTKKEYYNKGKDSEIFVIVKEAWEFLKKYGMIFYSGGIRKEKHYSTAKLYKINHLRFRKRFIEFTKTIEGQEFLKGKIDFKDLEDLAEEL